MPVTKSSKYLLCFPLCLAYLVNCVSLTQGHVDCTGDDPEQCEIGYYCDSDYRCKECALCENFQPSSPCAQSLLECGVCLDGYEYLSIGKCAVQRYDKNVGTILLLVATGCSAVVLLILIFSIAHFYMRKKRTKIYSCNNRYGPETEAIRNVAVAPSAPEYPSAPPPYTSHSPQPAFNSLLNESSEPLLKPSISAPGCQIEEHQMARPYSQYVRLPPGSHSCDEVNHNLNENEGIEDIDNESVMNNNELPTSRNPSVRRPAGSMLLPVLPADPGIDSLPMHNLTIATQVPDTNIIRCMETVGSRLDCADTEVPRSRPASPSDAAPDAAGAQQVIVQFISNVSPILNLQGNNTRR